MKISGPGPVQTTPVRRRERTGQSAGGGFADSLNGESAVRGSSPAARTDAASALLVLQEVDDPLEECRRAIARADDILEQLDELRHGLLIGALPTEKLGRLLTLVRVQQGRVTDPALREVLSEIELRAAVELAKLGRSP